MVVVALLVIATCATSWSLYAVIQLHNVRREQPADQLALGSLAWVLTATLGVLLVLLVWSILRWMALLLQTDRKLGPTQYVDAWSEAGRRIQVPGNGRRIDVDVHPDEQDLVIEAEPVPDETADEYLEYTPEYHERLDEQEDEELFGGDPDTPFEAPEADDIDFDEDDDDESDDDLDDEDDDLDRPDRNDPLR